MLDRENDKDGSTVSNEGGTRGASKSRRDVEIDIDLEGPTADIVRRRASQLDDVRARSFIGHRLRQSVCAQWLAKECRWIWEYLRYLERKNTDLTATEDDDVRGFLSYRTRFGICMEELRSIRDVLRMFHAHLWRQFDIRSVGVVELSAIDIKTMHANIPYANLRPTEVLRLSRSAGTRRNELMFRTMYEGVLSPKEIRSLSIADLHIGKGYIQLSDGKTYRRVPLLVGLVEELQNYVEGGGRDARPEEAPLFPSNRGGYLTTNTVIYQQIRHAAERAGLATERPHPSERSIYRLTTQTLRFAGRDRWSLEGVPELLCESFQTYRRRGDATVLTSQEREHFDTFRAEVTAIA